MLPFNLKAESARGVKNVDASEYHDIMSGDEILILKNTINIYLFVCLYPRFVPVARRQCCYF